MPSKHNVITVGIIVFFLSTIALSFLYGPWRRTYNVPAQVLSVESTEQIARIWEEKGLRGRIVICFTRYLNAVDIKESKDYKVTEKSMDNGILRKVYHIAPDSAWPEIRYALSKMNGVRTTQNGYIGIFDSGRVYINPLSRFSSQSEKSLILIEPKVWTTDEINLIAGKLKSGAVVSDLIIIVRGSERDAELFRTVMKQP
jgi:hypothetical protein